MNRRERRKNAEILYQKFTSARERILLIDPKIEEPKLKSIRAELACLEHQLSVLRLLQAEDRLVQYLWRAVFGLIGAGVGAAALYFN